jgi:hypothetical protein
VVVAGIAARRSERVGSYVADAVITPFP